MEQLLAPRHLPLVQQQLGTLESGRILLQLEVWPRQWMDWEIEQQGDERACGETPAGPPVDAAWSTRMRLALPRLGTLDARLRLDRDGLQLQLQTGDEASTRRLRAERPALLGALQQAGLRTTGLVITTQQHGPA
jgi:hypothetical protein